MLKIGKRQRVKVEVVPFEFPFYRDDEEELYTFNARPRTDVTALAVAYASSNKHPERAVSGMMAMIGRMLDNKDGTPYGWEPTALPLLAGDLPEGDEEGAPDGTPRFRGPDGVIYPMAEAERFTSFEAGSSRRRWRHLMDDDDEVEVQSEDLVELLAKLLSLAGKGHTPKSG